MWDGDLWPTHAYIPGKTPRHEEGAFDTLRATASPDLDAAELSNCQAFQTGLKYLKSGYYWEAHELFEPVWMALPDPSCERIFVQGLIQIANGFLKLKMDRPKAAIRLERIARALVINAGTGTVMGVEQQEMLGRLGSLRALARDAL